MVLCRVKLRPACSCAGALAKVKNKGARLPHLFSRASTVSLLSLFSSLAFISCCMWVCQSVCRLSSPRLSALRHGGKKIMDVFFLCFPLAKCGTKPSALQLRQLPHFYFERCTWWREQSHSHLPVHPLWWWVCVLRPLWPLSESEGLACRESWWGRWGGGGKMGKGGVI